MQRLTNLSMLNRLCSSAKVLGTSSRCSFSSQEFNYKDPFLIEDQLNEEDKMLRDTVRKYCEEVLEERIHKNYREELVDMEMFKEMGELGLIGATYQDGGISHIAQGLIHKELGRLDGGIQMAYATNDALCLYPISKFAQEGLRDKLLPELLSGAIVACYALTPHNFEPSFARMLPEAKRRGDEFILNGKKALAINAPVADVFVIWAKDEQSIMRGFVVTKDMKGIQVEEKQNKLGARLASIGNVVLHDVAVPKENVLHVEGEEGIAKSLDEVRLAYAWGALGAAEACFHQVLDYTLNRKQFRKPLAQMQLIQKKLADMCTEITIGQQSTFRATQLKEAGEVSSEAIALLKRNNCTQGLVIARNARDMLGGNGITDEYKVIRHMLNFEAMNTYEGTPDAIVKEVGKSITGVEALA